MISILRSILPEPLSLGRSARRVAQVYYGFQFFFSLFIWLPIFYEYQKKIGLSDQQIFSIQSIYYWVFCFLEIPTGLLADRWGYRFCMRLGSVTLVIAGVLPILLPGYLGFLAHFLLIALSRSLISGASSAYLYEFLRNSQLETGSRDLECYQQIEGRARAYSLLGKVVLWPCAGGLMQWHFSSPYGVTVIANSLAIGFAYCFPKIKTHEKKTGSPPQFSEVFSILSQRPILGLIMVQGVALFTLSRLVQINMFQPLLNARGIPLAAHGFLMSFMTIFETWGSFSPRIPFLRDSASRGKSLAHLNSVFVFTLVVALSMIGLGSDAFFLMFGSSSLWVALGIFSFATGASFPVQKQLMNDAIPDSRFRATLLSLESILDRAVCAWVAGTVGSFVARGRVSQFFMLSAWLSLFGVMLLYVIMRNKIKSPKIFPRHY